MPGLEKFWRVWFPSTYTISCLRLMFWLFKHLVSDVMQGGNLFYGYDISAKDHVRCLWLMLCTDVCVNVCTVMNLDEIYDLYYCVSLTQAQYFISSVFWNPKEFSLFMYHSFATVSYSSRQHWIWTTTSFPKEVSEWSSRIDYCIYFYTSRALYV